MNAPDTLPCKCMNPSCGITFYASNPFVGGGSNIIFCENTTTCHRCGQVAQIADWHTDAQGNFHLRDFFHAIRNFKDREKLKNLKVDLEAVEAANEPLTTEVLVDTLVALEPSFEKFKQVLYSIPKEKIWCFIQILLTIIPLVISYKM